jgi:hypothetical protein
MKFSKHGRGIPFAGRSRFAGTLARRFETPPRSGDAGAPVYRGGLGIPSAARPPFRAPRAILRGALRRIIAERTEPHVTYAW